MNESSVRLVGFARVMVPSACIRGHCSMWYYGFSFHFIVHTARTQVQIVSKFRLHCACFLNSTCGNLAIFPNILVARACCCGYPTRQRMSSLPAESSCAGKLRCIKLRSVSGSYAVVIQCLAVSSLTPKLPPNCNACLLSDFDLYAVACCVTACCE